MKAAIHAMAALDNRASTMALPRWRGATDAGVLAWFIVNLLDQISLALAARARQHRFRGQGSGFWPRDVDDKVVLRQVLAHHHPLQNALGAASDQLDDLGRPTGDLPFPAIGREFMPGAGGVRLRFVAAIVLPGAFHAGVDTLLARGAVELRVLEPQFGQFQARVPLAL